MRKLDGKRLKRKGPGIYCDESGDTYRLVPVDREYSGKKAPVYYLQAIKNGKATYISGVFKTNQEGVLSADQKDGIGVKVYYDLKVGEGGEVIEIARRRKKPSTSNREKVGVL